MRKPKIQRSKQFENSISTDHELQNVLIAVRTPINSHVDGHRILTNPSQLRAAILDDNVLLSMVRTVIRHPVRVHCEVRHDEVLEFITLEQDHSQPLPTLDQSLLHAAQSKLSSALESLSKNDSSTSKSGADDAADRLRAGVTRLKQKLSKDSALYLGTTEMTISNVVAAEVHRETKENVELKGFVVGWFEPPLDDGVSSPGQMVLRTNQHKRREVRISVPSSFRDMVLDYLKMKNPVIATIDAVTLGNKLHGEPAIAERGHMLKAIDSRSDLL